MITYLAFAKLQYDKAEEQFNAAETNEEIDLAIIELNTAAVRLNQVITMIKEGNNNEESKETKVQA